MEIGKKYNWKNQKERLIYLGNNWSGNGYWHQFALVESPNKVWSECLDSELSMIEETKPKNALDDLAKLASGMSNRQLKKRAAELHNKAYLESLKPKPRIVGQL